jgi:hypothetical protein
LTVVEQAVAVSLARNVAKIRKVCPDPKPDRAGAADLLAWFQREHPTMINQVFAALPFFEDCLRQLLAAAATLEGLRDAHHRHTAQPLDDLPALATALANQSPLSLTERSALRKWLIAPVFAFGRTPSSENGTLLFFLLKWCKRHHVVHDWERTAAGAARPAAAYIAAMALRTFVDSKYGWSSFPPAALQWFLPLERAPKPDGKVKKKFDDAIGHRRGRLQNQSAFDLLRELLIDPVFVDTIVRRARLPVEPGVLSKPAEASTDLSTEHEALRKRYANLACSENALVVNEVDDARLPLAVVWQPAALMTVDVREGRVTAPTFHYETRTHDEYFRSGDGGLPAKVEQHIARLTAEGATVRNGDELAALKLVEDDAPPFRMHIQKIRYFDVLAATVVEPPRYDGAETASQIWGEPRGSFFGESALVFLADGFVPLQVRTGHVAADRFTVNASISGASDWRDFTGDGPPTTPLESGLLREGHGELSRVLSDALKSQGGSLTFLAWLRNMHRTFMPELVWALSLRDFGVEQWQTAWREHGHNRIEKIETADESKRRPERHRAGPTPWLPSLVFVPISILRKHARDVFRFDLHWLVSEQDTCKTTLDTQQTYRGRQRSDSFEWMSENLISALPLVACVAGACLHGDSGWECTTSAR